MTMEEADGAAPAASWKQYSILVVDDEEGMRSFITRALAGRCGLVEAAASAEEGAALVSRCRCLCSMRWCRQARRLRRPLRRVGCGSGSSTFRTARSCGIRPMAPRWTIGRRAARTRIFV